jgi:hypothetical protein
MNIIELGERLRAVSERAGKNADNLRRESQYVTETMQKVQSNFGNQSAGQQVVTALYNVINSLGAADSALNALNSRIAVYNSETRK